MAFAKSCLAASLSGDRSRAGSALPRGNRFRRRYNGRLHRWLLQRQGFFAVLPMMDGDLGGKFGSCVALRCRWFSKIGTHNKRGGKAQSLIVAHYKQMGI